MTLLEGAVLVTGSGGLLGAAVVARLSALGVEVIAVSRQHDLGSVPAVACVVHCAAVLPATHRAEDAREAAETNTAIDRSVVAFCQGRGARLVNCSSASLYGRTGPEPVTESSPLAPPGPYAEAKLSTEQLCVAALASSCSLRLTALYGPGQRTRTVMRIFAERTLLGLGSTYHGSGTREQDFLHAGDAARACVMAAFSDDTHRVLNVCAGEPITMRDLARLFADAGPTSSGPSGEPDPQEGAMARYDRTLAGRTLGWTPNVSLAAGAAQLVSALQVTRER